MRISNTGYVRCLVKGSKAVDEHVLIAERVLGRRLPRGAVVHHWDENRSNNKIGNLVICPSRAYHSLLHYRMRALEFGGNANFKKCQFCKKWDSPGSLFKRGKSAYAHRLCDRLYQSHQATIKRQLKRL